LPRSEGRGWARRTADRASRKPGEDASTDDDSSAPAGLTRNVCALIDISVVRGWPADCCMANLPTPAERCCWALYRSNSEHPAAARRLSSMRCARKETKQPPNTLKVCRVPQRNGDRDPRTPGENNVTCSHLFCVQSLLAASLCNQQSGYSYRSVA